MSRFSKMNDLIRSFAGMKLGDVEHVGREVQLHGKLWEQEIGIALGATREELESINYIASVDIPGHFNRRNGVANHCKTTGKANVCMGSVLNTYRHLRDELTHLTVIQYQQRGSWKHVTSIYQLDISGMLKEFFGDISYEEVETLDNIIKNIPPGRFDKVQKNQIYGDFKKDLQNKSGIMSLNPKVDSRSQRRLQCSFNITKFLDRFGDKCIFRGEGNRFYESYISPKVKSEQRTFKG